MTEPIAVPVQAKRGRPVKLRWCLVCASDKPTSKFSSGSLHCMECGRAMRLRRPPVEPGPEVKVQRLAKRDAKHAASVARREEAAAERKLAKLRASPAVAIFKQQMAERASTREVFAKTAAFFRAICPPRCECCYTESSTGQDTIGLKFWCTLCGWGIERTGRCLAHPGETYYPGMPSEGFTLPAELLATMRVPPAPHYPTEEPTKEPGEE